MKQILFQDDYLLVVSKPSGLLTHRTPMNKGERDSLVDRWQDEIGQKLFTVHRLDKSTSGVVVMTKSKEAARNISEQFKKHSIAKTYIALVRGYLPDKGFNERPLRVDTESPFKEALTRYWCLKQIELEVPVSRYPTSRYSLALLKPSTGRYHQLRKHMAHLRHYIIGDKRHGDVKHNKVFSETHQISGLFLHAYAIAFKHPLTDDYLTVNCPTEENNWLQLEKLFDWNLKEILAGIPL